MISNCRSIVFSVSSISTIFRSFKETLIETGTRVWHPGPGNSRSREFCSFLEVPVPVPEKIGPGKKYRYRYRKNLVPEKSTGTGTEKIWSRKKVPVPVPEKNWSRKKVPVPVSEKIGPGTVEFPGTPGLWIFSYLHVPLGTGKRKCPFKGSHHLRKLFFQWRFM